MLKKISALLISICLLTGCSTAELGYMALAMELNQLKSIHLEGSLNMNLSKELIENTPGLKKDFSDGGLEAFTEFGSLPVLRYVGQTKTAENNIEADIKFYFKQNAEQEEQYLFNMIIKDNCWYIDTKGVLNIYNLAVLFYPEADKSFISDFQKETKGYEYILINYEPIYLEEARLASDEVKVIKELIAEVFKNFETGLVQQTDNGYCLKANAPKAVNCLVKGAAYLSDNSRYVYDTVSKNEWVKENAELEDYESFSELLLEMKKEALLFQESFNAELMAPESQLSPYKDSYYSIELNKRDGVYHLTNKLVGVYAGSEFCSIKSTLSISPKEVTVAAPAPAKVYKMYATGGAYPGGVYEVEVYEVTIL